MKKSMQYKTSEEFVGILDLIDIAQNGKLGLGKKHAENLIVQRSISILIMPSYMAKGLEFDAVIICDADSRTYSRPEDRKILYVECRFLPACFRCVFSPSQRGIFPLLYSAPPKAPESPVPLNIYETSMNRQNVWCR